MINWTLWQYKNIVDSFLATCGLDMQEVLLRRLDLLSEKGIDTKRPISAPIGDKLFELRGKAKNREARLLYYFGENREVIFVHAIYKSGSAISRHDKEIALANKRNVEEGRESPHGLNLTH